MYLTNRIKLHYKNILYQDLLLKNQRPIFLKNCCVLSHNNTRASQDRGRPGVVVSSPQPIISEIIVSTSSKKVLIDHVLLLSYINSLNLITGQIPTKTKSRKSIANFKLRSSQLMGCKVNLRGERGDYFIDKLLSIVFPKIREFEPTPRQSTPRGHPKGLGSTPRGHPKGLGSTIFFTFQHTVGKNCNTRAGREENCRVSTLTVSLKDLFLFPELEENYDLFENLNGIDITFVTTAKSKEETLLLLSGFQLPVT